MTRDEITALAREAGFIEMGGQHGALLRFALLVQAREREACALLAYSVRERAPGGSLGLQERQQVADLAHRRADGERDLARVLPLVVLQLRQHALRQRPRVDRPSSPHQRVDSTASATRSGVIAAIASRQCWHGMRQPHASPGAASSV